MEGCTELAFLCDIRWNEAVTCIVKIERAYLYLACPYCLIGSGQSPASLKNRISAEYFERDGCLMVLTSHSVEAATTGSHVFVDAVAAD